MDEITEGGNMEDQEGQSPRQQEAWESQRLFTPREDSLPGKHTNVFGMSNVAVVSDCWEAMSLR